MAAATEQESEEPAEGRATAELRLSGTRDIQDSAGALARSMASKAGVDPARLTRLRAVVEELVREARARQVATANDEILVKVVAEEGIVEIEVVDQALPVSAKESRHAASRRLAALGFVDELHIRTQGKRGNVARCTLRIAPTESHLAGEQLAADAERVSDEEAAKVEIRKMEPADAPALVRCVYRCYGYSYKAAVMYEPSQIRRALRSGAMTSVVAVAGDGSVVGHAAVFIERAGDAVPESGRMIVDPRYRGRGLAGRMAALRRELVEKASLPGFWAEAVTNHPASQREFIDNGGWEVGLLIGASPPSEMLGFGGAAGRRTLLAMYTPVHREALTVYVPERHAEFVRTVAGWVGAEREIVTEATAPTGETRLWTSVESDAGLARIRVDAAGADLPSKIADAVDGLDAFNLDVVHLDLPLSDGAAVAAVDGLESLGFSLAAWVPRFADGSDMLRLQRTGGIQVDAEDIVCARPEGEHVRDYVLAEWRRVRRGGID